MKIDYNQLKEQIRQIAQDDIKVISSGSLKLYASDVKEAFKKHVSALVKETYSAMVDVVPEEKQLDFINLETGYVISMTKWINDNPILVPNISIEDEDKDTKQEGDDLRELVHRKEVQIIGVGTALSLILFVSGFKIWALIAESLAVACGIYEYNSQKELTQKVNIQKERELQSRVNAFISSVEANAMDWAKKAEKQSQLILSKYQ